MSTNQVSYPPAPPGIPADLTTPTARYRIQVLLVLMSLLFFVLLYLGLVAGTGLLTWWAVTYPMGTISKGSILLKIGLIAISAMLFVFFLKGLFKRQHVDTSTYVPVLPEEQPELFEFIRRLCQETRAPFPRRVYLSPEVNAAVFYDSSLLSLIIPVRKNLLIGLGLVNMLTLDEFKAVLAHEFGHFSQSSMKVGTYVYTANRIITDMVYGRDAWDRLLAEWQQADVRIGIFGWILGGAVWGLRQVLAGLFRLINLGHLALSRQMEFNADLVAVRVTGSDSLIHALAKLEPAGQALSQAIKDLQAASDHGLYSPDVFYHQARALQYLRQLLKKPEFGQAPDLPTNAEARSQVFQPGESGIPSMWATHPSNFDREQNAKHTYFRSIRDERSPWLLFQDAAKARATVSRLVYRTWTEPGSETATDKVQAFIDEEHAETTYDAKYHGLYDGRFLEPGDVNALAKEAPISLEDLASAHTALYDEDLPAWMEAYRKRLGEFTLLSGFRHGQLAHARNDLSFRGRPCRAVDVDRFLQVVEKELEEDRRQLAEFDRQVFCVHYNLGRTLDERVELLSRYRFHLAAQEVLRDLNNRSAQVNGVVQFLAGGPQLNEADFAEVSAIFREAHDSLRNALIRAEKLTLPRLRNMAAGTPLADFLLEERLISELRHGASIDGSWIGGFLKQLALVIDRLQRLHFKSLGGILALQEHIARAWHQRQASPCSEASTADDGSRSERGEVVDRQRA